MDRQYTISLRKDVATVPPYKRAKKAVNSVRDFLKKHMKAEDVRLGVELNKHLWSRGIKNPPMKVSVNVTEADGVVSAELVGVKVEEPKVEKKKAETPVEKVKEKVAEKQAKKTEAKAEVAPKATPADVKPKPAAPAAPAPKAEKPAAKEQPKPAPKAKSDEKQ